jgi:hypothetical protein
MGPGRRRPIALLMLVVALVLAVLVVRPGTRGDLDTAAPPSATPVPTAPDSRVPSPDDLAGATLDDLTPSASGAGALRLGASVGAMVAAGWVTSASEHGCSRLREVRTTDGTTVSGWVREGRLVAVQVLAGRLPRPGPDGAGPPPVPGSLFGEPVDAATTPEHLSVERRSAQEAEVATARWQVAEDRTLVVSDLGTGVVRWAEVRTGTGEVCELSPEVVGADPPLVAAGEVDAALEDMTGVTVAELEEQLGGAADALAADAVTSREQPAPGCERVALGDRFVDTYGDVVVLAGQEVGPRDATAPRVTWRAPVGAPTVRVLERVDRVMTVRVREDGVRLAVDYLLRSWAPPGVDAFAVTEPPRVERVEVGVGCPSALPFT